MSDSPVPASGSRPPGPGPEPGTPPTPGGPTQGGPGGNVLFAPLLDLDQAKVGDFWLDARAVVRPSGVGYLGHDDDGSAVLLVVLSEGAARDPAARDRFAGEVNVMHVDTVVARGGQGQDEGRLADKFRGEDHDPVSRQHPPLAPWVALAYDGSTAALAEADRLLATVALVGTRQLGAMSGPDHRLAWIDNTAPGRGRLWPLPWPGRHDRAGWITILVSWLLMVLLAAIAVLIAVLLFQNAPPEPPQPPVPTSASASGGGSGSPSSASASAPSGSASPSQSSPGQGGEASDHPSMASANPSGSASGPAGSTPPNRRL